MAVDFFEFLQAGDRVAIEEAPPGYLKSMERLIQILSSPTAVSKFKQVTSPLNRTGHARFRRAPVQNPAAAPVMDLKVETETERQAGLDRPEKVCLSLPQPVSSSTTSSSFLSTISGDGSVTNGKVGAVPAAPPAPVFSAAKPPLSTSHRKKCHDHALSASAVGCHCSKRRKNRMRRAIRVPAVSSKNADIPLDEFSWRKYGQKPIKGSPFARGYYRCSNMKGCPAKKHVERAPDDPAMLIVTYEGEHRHTGNHPAFTPLPETAASAARASLLFSPS
ncbi:hypothetical protein SAY87_008684 [Trapa incisa]|uniref:WRKY domain-containing protein n=1 Tax=Trapa incisa TaxID=236973 RepID=A0AAN7JXM2_9MYRT|nr:hypothetical protein SAY87_008684 [Trapa incisa]